jgi:hypothetical protein
MGAHQKIVGCIFKLKLTPACSQGPSAHDVPVLVLQLVELVRFRLFPTTGVTAFRISRVTVVTAVDHVGNDTVRTMKMYIRVVVKVWWIFTQAGTLVNLVTALTGLLDGLGGDHVNLKVMMEHGITRFW